MTWLPPKRRIRSWSRQGRVSERLNASRSRQVCCYRCDVSGFGASGARFWLLGAALAHLTATTISSTSLLKVSRPSISTNSRPLHRILSLLLGVWRHLTKHLSQLLG